MKAFKYDPSAVVKSGAPKHRAMFSRARDFALVLTPITIGVAYRLLVEINPGGTLDDSLSTKAFTFFMFVFGLGGGLALLNAVNRLEDWEDHH